MNKPTHNNKQLDPDYIKKEQEKTMKKWFGDKGYEALDKMVERRLRREISLDACCSAEDALD